jgi:hypothetical protein
MFFSLCQARFSLSRGVKRKHHIGKWFPSWEPPTLVQFALAVFCCRKEIRGGDPRWALKDPSIVWPRLKTPRGKWGAGSHTHGGLAVLITTTFVFLLLGKRSDERLKIPLLFWSMYTVYKKRHITEMMKWRTTEKDRRLICALIVGA